MSLIAHTFLPRFNMFDMNGLLRPTSFGRGAYGDGPSTLDIFDPFDDLDRTLSRNLMWLDKPAFLDFGDVLQVPRVPQKYRITLDCRGYSPKSIKTEVKDGKLIVSASEGNKQTAAESDGGDFSIKEFKKTYTLPENVERADKMVSFMTSNGQLVVEIPLKQQAEADQVKQSSPSFMMPRIVETGENGQKSVKINLSLPNGIDPSMITVTCKDRDLIVKAETTTKEDEANNRSFSQTFFYQRATLPQNTDLNGLKCLYENNKLAIEAPLQAPENDNELKENGRSIPIEFKQQQQQQQQQQQIDQQ